MPNLQLVATYQYHNNHNNGLELLIHDSDNHAYQALYLAYSVKDSYFDDSSFPLEYEILDKNDDIVEDNDNNIANFNSFRDAIDHIQNRM